MKERMHIVCATDNNYAALCGIMLSSLLENNMHRPISVYILTDGLKPGHCKRLKSLAESGKYDAEINICVIDTKALEGCDTSHNPYLAEYLNKAVFSRFLIADILPADCKKCLYLDCDIVVDGDISELYDTDITDYAVAAVPEHDGESGRCIGKEAIERLNYPLKSGYFNAGVMLINLSYWRENDVKHAAISYFVNNVKKCFFFDQDVLNAILHDKELFLPYKYNVMASFFECAFEDLTALLIEERPVIIHYCSAAKPWNWYFGDYPFKNRWKYYRNRSKWKHWRSRMPFKKLVKEIARNILYFSKGKRYRYYRSSWRKWE